MFHNTWLDLGREWTVLLSVSFQHCPPVSRIFNIQISNGKSLDLDTHTHKSAELLNYNPKCNTFLHSTESGVCHKVKWMCVSVY
jgi:hypothetical protein